MPKQKKLRLQQLHISSIIGSLVLVMLGGLGFLLVRSSKASSYISETISEESVLASFTEREPNNNWTEAKASGPIVIAHNTIYTGNFGETPTVTSSDKFYIKFNDLATRRTFNLVSTNINGVQMVLWYYKPGSNTPVLVRRDDYSTSPINFTASFVNTGDYQLDIHVDPSKQNTSSYSLQITNPDIAVTCPWSGPIALSTLPGTGSMQTASNYIVGGQFFQTFTRGGQGWARAIPIDAGVVQWSQATPWAGPFVTTVYKYPGSGTLQTESEYTLGNNLYHGVWRGDQGWTRTIPIVDNTPLWSCSQN